MNVKKVLLDMHEHDQCRQVTEIVTKGEKSISPLSMHDLSKLCDQPSKPRSILVRLT